MGIPLNYLFSRTFRCVQSILDTTHNELLQIEGLAAKMGRKYKPRKRKQEVTDTPNLLTDAGYKLESINQVLTSDTTYIPTEEG